MVGCCGRSWCGIYTFMHELIELRDIIKSPKIAIFNDVFRRIWTQPIYGTIFNISLQV